MAAMAKSVQRNGMSVWKFFQEIVNLLDVRGVFTGVEISSDLCRRNSQGFETIMCTQRSSLKRQMTDLNQIFGFAVNLFSDHWLRA